MHQQTSPSHISKEGTMAESKRVVLIADDYPENRRLVYFYLRDTYDVLQASTAEEAIEMLRSNDVDLTILDLNFCDGMSGIEAIQVIRSDEQIRDVKTLALTAYAYPDDRQRCIEAGFNDYIAKPVFKNGLLAKLDTILGNATSGDSLDVPSPENVWISQPGSETDG